MSASIPKLLHTDGIQEAENITGKSYKEDPRTDALGFALTIQKNRELHDALQATGDTHHGSTLDEYLAIIADMGFRVVLDIPFVGDTGRDNRAERFIVAWDDTRGILLEFDTWDGRKVNGGSFAFNWRCDPYYAERPRSERLDWWTGGGSHGPGRVDPTVDTFTMDCREAIRWKFQRAAAVGQFVTPWVERPYLSLLHYQDWHDVRDLDFKARRAETDRRQNERLALLPAEVLRAITPKNVAVVESAAVLQPFTGTEQ